MRLLVGAVGIEPTSETWGPNRRLEERCAPLAPSIRNRRRCNIVVRALRIPFSSNSRIEMSETAVRGASPTSQKPNTLEL